MSAVIEAVDLTIAYDRHPAVHHLNGRFEAGSLTAIVGPNGGGKSTLLKTIVGLMAPSSGQLRRQGVAPRDIAYLPQQAELDRNFPISVFDTVLLGLWRRLGLFRGASARDRAAVVEALAAVGLIGFEGRQIGTLSSGQFQRVLFARLLLQDARVIALDEPFNAVDGNTTGDLLALVARWHGEGRTVIAVLHDLEQVRRHFPQTLVLARDAVAWGPTAAVLTPDSLLRARGMAEAWSRDAAICAAPPAAPARRRA